MLKITLHRAMKGSLVWVVCVLSVLCSGETVAARVRNEIQLEPAAARAETPSIFLEFARTPVDLLGEVLQIEVSESHHIYIAVASAVEVSENGETGLQEEFYVAKLNPEGKKLWREPLSTGDGTKISANPTISVASEDFVFAAFLVSGNDSDVAAVTMSLDRETGESRVLSRLELGTSQLRLGMRFVSAPSRNSSFDADLYYALPFLPDAVLDAASLSGNRVVKIGVRDSVPNLQWDFDIYNPPLTTGMSTHLMYETEKDAAVLVVHEMPDEPSLEDQSQLHVRLLSSESGAETFSASAQLGPSSNVTVSTMHRDANGLLYAGVQPGQIFVFALIDDTGPFEELSIARVVDSTAGITSIDTVVRGSHPNLVYVTGYTEKYVFPDGSANERPVLLKLPSVTVYDLRNSRVISAVEFDTGALSVNRTFTAVAVVNSTSLEAVVTGSLLTSEDTPPGNVSPFALGQIELAHFRVDPTASSSPTPSPTPQPQATPEPVTNAAARSQSYRPLAIGLGTVSVFVVVAVVVIAAVLARRSRAEDAADGPAPTAEAAPPPPPPHASETLA